MQRFKRGTVRGANFLVMKRGLHRSLSQKRRFFEEPEGGTLLLDEVGT